MDLLKDIIKKRAKQRQKKPIQKDVFNQISGIVRLYGLKESFMDALVEIEENFSTKNFKFSRIRLKVAVESPLFSLVTKDEYFLTMSIIKKIDNPYLKFVHSPEEIIWCEPLYRLNPSMDSEKLIRYHFETLYLHERFKAYGNKAPHQTENLK
ncbi:MAG: hypothetical protein JRE65_10865 [Deltaproteobacteria bacterium]|jgi:hypothetical protein|nr:hypothetical protein [Deltaproteobacteria bacterium]